MKNRTIGIVPYPEYGGYYPTFALARMLIKNEVNVIYFGPPAFKDMVENQGLKFEAVLEEQYANELFNPNQIPEKFKFIEKIKHWADYNLKLILPILNIICNGYFEQLLLRHKIDLLIVDSLLVPISIAACNTSVKVINFSCELNAHGYNNLPTTTGWVPSGFLFIRLLQVRLCWIGIILKRFIDLFFYSFLLRVIKTPGLPPEISKEMKRIKKETKRKGFNYIQAEYECRPLLPELILCFREFDYPHNLEASGKHYIYLCVDEQRYEKSFSWETIDRHKPLIYCSLGTHIELYSYAHRFLGIIVDAARNMPDRYFIVSAGKNVEKIMPLLPANMLVFDKVPQLDILKKARLMITNGGLGTIKECILNEVPMIILPCNYDQPGNAARVMFHGIGLKSNIRKISYTRLTGMIDEILMNKRFYANIKQLHRRIINNQCAYNDMEIIGKYFHCGF